MVLEVREKEKAAERESSPIIITENKEVILLTIYDKQVKSDISEKELAELLNELNL